MKDTEHWKQFSLDGRYEISDEGRVRNTMTQRIRNCTVNAGGYKNFVVTYPKSKKTKTFDVHVAVAITWLGPRPPKFDVSHRDGNRTNNAASNLLYESRKDNMNRRGTVRYHDGKRKLSASDVVAIRASDLKVRDLAILYNVGRGMIWKIKTRVLWKHL